jgi:two-component SAPR family response regulator
MVMPGGITGAQLAQQVRETYPAITVVFTSGYAQDGTRVPDSSPWLRKPYTLDQMEKILREVLG